MNEPKGVPAYVVGTYLGAALLIVGLVISRPKPPGCANCGNTAPDEGDAGTPEMYHSLGQYSTFHGTGGQVFSNAPYRESPQRVNMHMRVM